MPPSFVVAVLGIPLVVLAISYLVLADEFGTGALWRVPIHESGRRTLGETIFYYDHFLRELPIDTLFAAAIVNSYAAAGVEIEAAAPPIVPGLLLALFLVWIVVGSVRSVGVRVALGDLLQLHETDVRRGWGSHWQMHFLSTAAIVLLLLLPAALLGTTAELVARAAPLILLFVAASVIFGTGLKAVTNARWILHGAREMVTYASMVAVPFFVPLLSLQPRRTMAMGAAGAAMSMCLAVIAIYFIVVHLRSDLTTEASSPRGVAFLLSSHFFEHVLDYLYIILVVLLGISWMSR